LSVLRIEGLTVRVGGREVLRGVDLEVPEGETHVLLGPNGSGKTSLIMSVMGFPSCQVLSGRILFDGIDITNFPTDERARLGLGVAFQNPPAIRGVKLGDVFRHMAKGEVSEVELARVTNIPVEFLERDLNIGFSGGELKRSEIFQVLAQRPSFAIFDEPDSGVDVENLEVIGRAIGDFLKGRSGLLITHLGHILRYVRADVAHVLVGGRIACSGGPNRIFRLIMKRGYKWCERCPKMKKTCLRQ
jgi:Fe-S cluster assembly ATP-binding protein